MSDADYRLLERQARALGVDARELAREVLGIEPGRFLLLTETRRDPSPER